MINQSLAPFLQVDALARLDARGASVTFSLAQKIIDAQGSRLHVDPVEGKGSAFEFPALVGGLPRQAEAAHLSQDSRGALACVDSADGFTRVD